MSELWSDDNTLEAQEGWRKYKWHCRWKWAKRIFCALAGIAVVVVIWSLIYNWGIQR